MIKAGGQGSEDKKIGEYVRESMRTLFFNEMLSEEVISNLKDKEFCKKTFNLDFPMLTEDQNETTGRHARYWIEKFGDRYYVSNHWFKSQRELFDAWYDKILFETLTPDEEPFVGDEIKIFVGYAWHKGASALKDLFWGSIKSILTPIRKTVQDRFSEYSIKISVNRLRASHGEFVYNGIFNRIKDADFLVFDVADVSSLFDEKGNFVGKFDSENNLVYKSFSQNVLFEMGITFGQGKECFALCPLCLKETIPSDLSNFMWTFYNTKLVRIGEENNRKEYFIRELKDERGFVNKFRGALAGQANKILKK